MLQVDPRSAFSDWVARFERVYKDNVEVLPPSAPRLAPEWLQSLPISLHLMAPSSSSVVAHMQIIALPQKACVHHVSAGTKVPYCCSAPMSWPSFPPQEYEHRFKVWLDNLEFIVEYNAQHMSHWVRSLLHLLRVQTLHLDAACPGNLCLCHCCCGHY